MSDADDVPARTPPDLTGVDPRVLLDQAPGAFMLLDRDWRYRYINPAGAAQVFTTVDALLGQVIWDKFPEAVGGSFHRLYHRVMASRVPEVLEDYYAPFARWYEVRAYPAGEGIGVHFADVTARKERDLALQATTRELARAQAMARTGNWTWDVATGAVTWSAEVYRLTGRDPATYVPHLDRVDEWAHPDDVPVLLAAIERARTDGAPYDLEFRMCRPDGEVLRVHALGEVLRAPDGTPLRIFGTMQDVTERRRAEEERQRLEQRMQHAQKLESLGVLAGGIAHDFNNLLVGILGNASMGLLDLPPGSPGRPVLVEIERAAQRAAELTRQLLAYSGKGRFVVGPLDLSEVVSEMTALLRTAMTSKADLRLDLARALPAIEADATQVRQVVMNLLTNASDALEDARGTIVLRTGVQHVDASWRETVVGGDPLADGRYVFLEVSDTGVGMGPETVARIFEPFFTTKFAGRGLGLAATLGIVRGHGGGIKVYSEPGKGTTFKLLFPASTRAAEHAAAQRARDAWTGAGTVLLVDDEPTVRQVARRLLERRGFAVVEAATGEEALALLADGRIAPRAAFLDLTMPGLGGEETFRRLRRLHPAIRIVLMSGYNEQNVTQAFVGKGLSGFVQKPFRAEELYDALAAALGEGEAHPDAP